MDSHCRNQQLLARLALVTEIAISANPHVPTVFVALLHRDIQSA